MGRAFNDEEKEALRMKIVKVGIEAFKTSPYENVKIDILAQRVGIAKGTFYLFSNQRRCFTNTVSRYLNRKFKTSLS